MKIVLYGAYQNMKIRDKTQTQLLELARQKLKLLDQDNSVHLSSGKLTVRQVWSLQNE